VFHKENGAWAKGPATHEGPWKRGDLTGPFRDVFRAPLLFVYGEDDPAQARANEEVARAFAKIRAGVLAHFPIMSDTEFLARRESLGNDKGLFLVGNARSNRVVRALESDLPIKVEGNAIVVGGAFRFVGNQLGAAFVRPNPKRPDRYLAVVEGVDALGTWRALSLPDLLPDFVVYDETLAPARGLLHLSSGAARAAGFFQNDWSLAPSANNWADPLAQLPRAQPKSEHDALPYLP
jgi:hypothetical protein